MNTNLEKITHIISTSTLPKQDKDDLIAGFSSVADTELESVITLFAENPEWIEKINENYKAKKIAFKSNDSNLWQKILETEKNDLEKVG